MNCLSISNCLSYKRDPIIDFVRKIGAVEDLHRWTKLPTETTELWITILNYKYAIGENPYIDFSNFVIGLLVLYPFQMERLFSQMNLIKTKIRNRMQKDMLKSILSVRATYEIPENLVKLINNNIYQKQNSSETDEGEGKGENLSI